MKSQSNSFTQKTLLAALALASAGIAWSADPTALELVKEGNRYVGEESENRVVQIRSEKSVGTLTPVIWNISYYDPDAGAKLVVVKFGAGKKLGVKRPPLIYKPFLRKPNPLNMEKVRIDSDRALEIAKAEPLLNNLTLTASKLKLEAGEEGPNSPVWKVRFYAAKLSAPQRSVDIGEVQILADEGKVVKSDLLIHRVD